jgi:penicillin amidase
MLRWLLKSLFWLLLLAIAAAAVTAWLYVRRATPTHDGALAMPGLKAAVTVERDEHGIPTIKATSLRDAMYALGVVHVQDRHWQLETHRRIGSGSLAEVFGEGALEQDKFLRALGVKRHAERLWAKASGESREMIEAYSAGINDTIARHVPARPPEMIVLGAKPEPWAPADTLAWSTMMAWDLGGNFNAELLRLRAALKLPVERIDQLTPPYPGDKPLVSTDYAKLYRDLKLDTTVASLAIDRLLAAAPPSGDEGAGSNNWVLAGSRTTTGKPLLANDPHLKLTTPALWYFARIEIPGLKVAGATMPGVPAIVLGQNDHLAWGFTNTGPDVQDLYLERIAVGDAARYDTPDGPKAFETFEEVIKVKGKPEVRFVARATRHGPVLSDVGTMNDVIGGRNGSPAYALALRWTALDEDNEQMATQLQMMRADSVAAFEAATRPWVAPQQNMVVADRAGRIGYVAHARVPLRGESHDLKGYVPAPGWEAKYDWVGTVPADQLPREFDPPRGWIATANQRIHASDYPHFMTSEWAAPFRQQRIEELLEAKPKQSIEDLRAIHADVKSLAATSLLVHLKQAQSKHPLAAAAHAELAAFDGTMRADAAAPAIYWAWLRHLTSGVLADELGPERFDASLANRQYRDAIESVLVHDGGRGDAWWCDDKRTPEPESCQAQNDAAFARALDELRLFYRSDDVKTWAWGKLHGVRAEHRPFSRAKALARLFELRVPSGGDTFTVNAARVAYRADATTGERYLQEHGPSLRAIYDVADPWQSRFMHSSGQSGLFWSKHYRDFLEPWARVEYVPVWGVKGATPAASLELRPAPNQR